MKTIGIRLADGTFYPILEEGVPKKRILDLTTANDNQTTVRVDLYRSESGTMDDAEYVDTLEVSKLTPKAVDDTELKLSIGLDENNELIAEVIDTETGRRSETQVNLVTRSADERTGDTDFAMKEPDSDNPFGMDAPDDDDMFHKIPESTSREMPAQEEIAPEGESTFSEDDTIPDGTVAFDEDATLSDSSSDGASDFDMPDIPDVSDDFSSPADSLDADATATETTIDDFTPPSDAALDDTTVADNDATIDSSDKTLDDIDFDVPNDDIITVENVIGETKTTPEDSIDEPFQFEEPAAQDDVTVEDSTTEPTASEEVSDDFSVDTSALPDFDDIASESVPDTDTTEEPTAGDDVRSFELPDFDDMSLDVTEKKSEEPSIDEPVEGETAASIAADLPDFSDFDTPSTSTDTGADSDDSFDISDLPDFDEMPTADKSISLDDDFSFKTDDTSSSNSLDSFDLPDFDNLSLSEQRDEKKIEDYIDESALSSSPSDSDFGSDMNLSSAPMDFSDLYDKETLNGEHATLYDDDDDDDRSRVPIIICIICALICIIATLLILFVIPSKYNLIKSKGGKTPTAVESVEKKDKPKQSGILSLPEKKQESVKLPSETPSHSTGEGVKEAEEPASEKKPLSETKITIPLQEDKPAVKEEPKKDVQPPSAEENKIVIIPEEAVEKTVPVKVDVPVAQTEPKKTETTQKKPKGEDVPYTIKWGDTLWDISDSYYKTPWKYLKIADYNHIKNPDIIISGTKILIPAE